MRAFGLLFSVAVLCLVASSCSIHIYSPEIDMLEVWAQGVDEWMDSVHAQLDNKTGNLGEIRSTICEILEKAESKDPVNAPLTKPAFCEHAENDDLEDPPCPITNPGCLRGG